MARRQLVTGELHAGVPAEHPSWPVAFSSTTSGTKDRYLVMRGGTRFFPSGLSWASSRVIAWVPLLSTVATSRPVPGFRTVPGSLN